VEEQKNRCGSFGSIQKRSNKPGIEKHWYQIEEASVLKINLNDFIKKILIIFMNILTDNY